MDFRGCVGSARAVAALAAVADMESWLEISLITADLSLQQLARRNPSLCEFAVYDVSFTITYVYLFLKFRNCKFYKEN